MAAEGHILVLGGQRSGKSRFAEKLVISSGLRKLYVATAAIRDSEMMERVALHRQSRRGEGWITVEETLDLAGAIASATREDAVLVDCLTLWLSNVMEAGRDIAQEQRGLIAAINASPASIVLVSNEVGLGIIPDNALGRKFADAQGNLNRHLASAVGRVVFMAAGRPILIKPSSAPEILL